MIKTKPRPSESSRRQNRLRMDNAINPNHASISRSGQDPRAEHESSIDGGGGTPRLSFPTLLGGLLTTLGSALISCLLLIVNGALVLAIIAAVGATEPNLQTISQFLLFALPVALLIVEWMMIDYLRRFWRQRDEMVAADHPKSLE